MATTREINPIFSPEQFSQEQLAISCLIRRMTTLPKEAMADLTTLAQALTECKSEEEYREIAETIREVLFPESILGGIKSGSFGQRSNGNLTKHSAWVGGKIREYRENAAMTQQQLAELTGLPQSHISRLENGEHSPSRKTIERIAQALKIDLRALDFSVDGE